MSLESGRITAFQSIHVIEAAVEGLVQPIALGMDVQAPDG